MPSLLLFWVPTSSNCLRPNDKRWCHSPHRDSSHSGAQSTFCKWLSLATKKHTRALTRAQTMACLWGYYLRVSSGRSWVHHTTLGPYLSRRHSLISIPLPALTSVPIAPRQRDWDVLLLLISTDDRVAQVEATLLSFNTTDTQSRLTPSVFMKLRVPPRRFILQTFSNDDDEGMCLRYDTSCAFPEVWHT